MDLPTEEQGAAVILRLGGAAHDTCAEIDPQIIKNGTYVYIDGVAVPVTGLEFLIRDLSRRYAPTAAEDTVKTISEMMMFGQQEGED
eukprot:15145244-Heterocapsa_arctica.AAC.1